MVSLRRSWWTLVAQSTPENDLGDEALCRDGRRGAVEWRRSSVLGGVAVVPSFMYDGLA